MPFDPAPLAPHVRAILDAASDADLQVISGKRVRRELLARAPALLSPADAKAHKDALEALIADVFADVSRARFGAPEPGDGGDGAEEDASEGATGTPAADEEDDDAEEDEDEEAEAKPKKKKQRRARGELTDEEYARQLASELNGRPRSTRTGAAATKRGGRGGGRGGKRGAKSAARVEDSDADSDGEGGGKKRKRKAGAGAGAGGGGAKGGFGKEYALSPQLAAVVGAEKMSRPQVVKHLWAHIKSHELQNPENKKQIMCDAALQTLFHVDKIDMFQMNKVLGQHLHQAE